MSQIQIAFPLALLGYGQSFEDQFHLIITTSSHSRGSHIAQTNDLEKSYQAGSQSGWHMSSFPTHKRLLIEAENHVKRYEDLAKTTCPIVRISKDYTIETFNRTVPYREFRILCAVYSCIGAKSVDLIRRSQILLRCSGLWNIKQIQLQSEKHFDEAPSENDLKYTLRKLESRSLVATLCYKRRDTYFSRTCDYEQLEKDVQALLQSKPRNLQISRKAEAQARLNQEQTR